MKGTEKKRSPSINQTKRFPRSERRDSKLQQENANKNLKAKETDVNALSNKQGSCVSINDSNTGTVTSEVYEEMAIHYVDDIYRSEEASQNKINGHCNDLEKEPQEARGESDSETINDSVSSHGDSQIPEDGKVEIISLVPKRLPKVKPTNNLQIKASPNTPKKSTKPNRGISEVTAKILSDYNSKNMKVHPNPSSDSSEGVVYKPLEEVKEIDIVDEAASNGVQIGGSDDETVNNEEKLKDEDNAALNKKIEEMEMRIGKLEEELREVAALEISLYSVVPEHSNSAHKVHAPARRLSRLYIHACKHWSQEKRATIARSTVSGLVLIAKSCGNDVPTLTFWLSNTVVLREIVTQAFGNSCQSSSLTRIFESNGIGKRSEGKYSSAKWKYNSLTRQPSKHVSVEFIDDWQETRTFTTALEKVESWIFSRIVESIWWQTLTPNMQSPALDINKSKATGKFLGPALGDQKQGSFSVNLWKNAFEDAFKRLCPIRAGGHECGCLPILARTVMEHCVARLDVAMFNAILRESAQEIPTDPVSDPIVDPKVLPIPAGDLSFGSGAQLKNAVGNWSRWLTDLFGTNVNDDQHSNENDNTNRRSGVAKLKCFNLLNSLSDLLMLPKDMLMDRSIRTEVCPSITLPLLKRILCNFTPDEFCPDPVPGTVLEAVNAECIVERRVLGETASGFPYRAAPIMYKPPHSHFATNASLIQRKGYTSDEELEELVSPLTSIIKKPPSSPPIMANGSRNENGNNGERKEQKAYVGANARYELLREVWLA